MFTPSQWSNKFSVHEPWKVIAKTGNCLLSILSVSTSGFSGHIYLRNRHDQRGIVGLLVPHWCPLCGLADLLHCLVKASEIQNSNEDIWDLWSFLFSKVQHELGSYHFVLFISHSLTKLSNEWHNIMITCLCCCLFNSSQEAFTSI